MNETVAMVEEMSDLWKPGAMDGNPPFMMNYVITCSYLLQLFFCIVCSCKNCCVFENLLFCFYLLMTWSKKLKLIENFYVR